MILDMEAVDRHVRQRITDTPVQEHPFPHFFVENVFPDEYYRQILANWPREEDLPSISDSGRVDPGRYRERHFQSLMRPATGQGDFWAAFSAWACSESFTRFLLDRYGHWIMQNRRLPASTTIGAECMIVQDHENYAIGPHTDAPHRLISTLFYCPADYSQRHMGTSLYVPSPGANIPHEVRATHYAHKLFRQVGTAPFIPNSLFGFVVTPNSFHGVEEDAVRGDAVRRNIILHFIRWRDGKDWEDTGRGSTGAAQD